MDTHELVAALTRPEAWGQRDVAVEVIHTHASVVFRLPEVVYKIKRPVDLGFLDYSTLTKRQQMCAAEVALNARLAPEVYLGVVPLCASAQGVQLDGPGEVVEYAVAMRRLPDDATLGARAVADTLDDVTVAKVARRLAQFHAAAPHGPELAIHARFDRVWRNALDNVTALRGAAALVPQGLLDRVEAATRAELEACRALIERRADAGVTCDGHGDLRLEHVYLLPPDDHLAIIDCIEFSPGFRAVDPIADVAFLAMDLQAHGVWWAAAVLWREYLAASGDAEGRPLVPSYMAYRSLVRAKVRAMQAVDDAATAVEREHAAALAAAHVRVAAAELLPAAERPSLVLVGGLPGTGKSVLAHGLEREAGYTWIRADAVRKELAGLDPTRSAHADVRAGIYTPQWNDRTYGVCLERAVAVLAAGGRVVVDASFKELRRRKAFIDAATRLGVPPAILVCTTPPAAVHERLDGRHDDPSDADWPIYEHVRATWEPLGPRCQRFAHTIDTSGTPAQSLHAAMVALELAAP